VTRGASSLTHLHIPCGAFRVVSIPNPVGHFGTCPTPKKSKSPTGRTGGAFSFASYSPMDLTTILAYTKKPGHFVILDTTFWRRNCSS
jgi:hypothetical protein